MYQFWQIHGTNQRNPLINYDKSKLTEFHVTNLTNPIWTKFNKSTDWVNDRMTRKGNYWTWVQWKKEIKKEKRKTCCCCGRMWSLVFHSGARAGWSCSSLPGFFVSELIGYFKWYLLPVTILLKNYYLKWCSKTHIYFVCFYSPPHSRHFLQRCWRPTPWSCTP